MNIIQVRTKKFVNTKNIDIDYIDMSDLFIVCKNDIGHVLMSENNVVSYAKELVESNPAFWDSFDKVIDITEADYIISNTLDNEYVRKYLDES